MSGLSPRVRGNRAGRGVAGSCGGSIPASAGEPSGRRGGDQGEGVYPRECGGTATRTSSLVPFQGLSPRVRGNRRRAWWRGRGRRSIPASAGEPRVRSDRGAGSPVYPRECGGTVVGIPVTRADKGLSPRVRGNRLWHSPSGRPLGSIPASAGEPLDTGLFLGKDGVYPRECGGTTGLLAQSVIGAGLSPRVRGNRGHRGRGCWGGGSIPASAGEPAGTIGRRRSGGVYPRECGGTGTMTKTRTTLPGLSPRVRGNQRRRDADYRRAGSIPASAGEPQQRSRIQGRAQVYPRECGGTVREAVDDRIEQGLSPRVRGNLVVRRPIRPCAGSIPASAGEPRPRYTLSSHGGVYPRECGGTRRSRWAARPTPGLSPRVRGNRDPHRRHRVRTGSIPASAGEPGSEQRRTRRSRVYPRECGGTPGNGFFSDIVEGLSPRVRGNQDNGRPATGPLRSIPASAGEPSLLVWGRRPVGVYPRECGGTSRSSPARWRWRGLSPRVRGNPPAWTLPTTYVGSIPASAGEPPAGFMSLRVPGVYPRECGGTRMSARWPMTSKGLSPRVRGNRRRIRLRGIRRGSIPASAGEP